MSQKFLNKPGFAHFWERLRVLFGGLDTRVTALEQSGGEANIIDSISFNGTNVPPDASKNVALVEADPTVPSWAKQSSKPTYTATEVGAIPKQIISVADITQADNAIPEGSVAQGTGIYIYDKNNRIVGIVSVNAYRDGRTGISISTNNVVNGNIVSASLHIYLDKNNLATYVLSNPSGFRAAISAQNDVGFYIDAQGYLCQRIRSDT
jgi:hypothetical protein